MAQLPADRTKLAQAQSNMAPSFTASSQKLKDALTEAYDTVDLLNQKADNHAAAATLPHADKSVTRAKLADKVVGAGQLDDAAVGQSHHQDNGIPSRALPDNVILQRHMSDNSVGSAEIQAGAVTATKIPNGTINSQHIDAALLASSASLATQVEFDKRGINVQKYGAKGEGTGNDTTAIQNAFDSIPATGGLVYIPDGTYMIDAVASLKPKSNTTIVLSPGATLKAITNAANVYNIVSMTDKSNIAIIGGSIVGERTTHTGSTGEGGMGVAMRGSNNITIRDTLIKDCWGDGIYIAESTVESSNIVIINVTCDNNRRNGISVTGCKGGIAIGSRFINTNGTAPQAGADLENNMGFVVERFKFIGCEAVGNAGDGFQIYGHGTQYNTFEACYAKSNTGRGLRLGSCDNNAFVNCIASNNSDSGIKIDSAGGQIGSTSYNKVIGCHSYSNTLSGIEMAGGASGQVDYNVIQDNHCTGNGVDGIALNGNTNFEINHNTVTGNMVKSNTRYGIYGTHVSYTLIQGNQVLSNSNAGIMMDATISDSNSIEDNLVKGNLYGINFFQGTNSIVKGNTVRENIQHGIRIRSGSNHNLIDGNRLEANGQATDNLYDGILIDSNADFNMIINNQCRRGALTNKSRYGIRINSVDCDNNVVSGNDCYDGGTTAGISNAGTTTSFGSGNRNKDATFGTTPN